MVNALSGIKRLSNLVFLLSLFLCQAAVAASSLIATVDRSKIYEMDTLNLTVEGEIDVDFSFGGLMNFGLNQSEKPDTAELEKYFVVLDTQQSYNMQSINGEAKARVLWRYTLSPKQTGVLTIPPIKFKDVETKAIEVNVLAGKAPKDSSQPPAVFLEVETDKKQAYVQEQIIYTLRLYTQGLINGELGEPNSGDAIIEPFGEQKKYYRMAFNQRYEVVERQYLIFPQKSGQLNISGQEFQGVTIHQGRRTRIRDISDPVQLTIKSPPAGFSGKTWLPATSLFLNEEWQGDPSAVKVGDSLSRKISVSSLGLLGSALPPVSMNEQAKIKLYTDKPQLETVQHESGAQSTRIDSFAIVALREGDIALEEIRIPWWDVVNDVEREAVIPASTLTILPNPQLTSAAPPSSTSADSVNNEVSSSEPGMQKTDLTGQAAKTSTNQTHLWQSLCALLLLVWILTAVYYSRKIALLNAHIAAIPLPQPASHINEKQQYDTLIQTIRENDKNLSQQLFKWLSCFDAAQIPASRSLNLQNLKAIDDALYRQLSASEAGLYGQSTQSNYDSARLLEAVKAFRQKQSLERKQKGSRSRARFFRKRQLESFYQ
jgi:hypothetical protein